jgi:general stress protein YciG
MAKSDPVRDYLATIGRKGGEATTPAKQAASRANGKRGGRPKKVKKERTR